MKISYKEEELLAIYELGRMYYNMGYFVAAEKIFSGLAAIDNEVTPAAVGLGLVKIERGLISESVQHFRKALDSAEYEIDAKVGLGVAFVGLGEFQRAKLIFEDIRKKRSTLLNKRPDLQRLVSAFISRCEESGGDVVSTLNNLPS